jgi:hypothetical protein
VEEQQVMHPYEKVVLKFGTLVFIKIRGHDHPELVATCTSDSHGKYIAELLAQSWDIPLEVQ